MARGSPVMDLGQRDRLSTVHKPAQLLPIFEYLMVPLIMRHSTAWWPDQVLRFDCFGQNGMSGCKIKPN